MCEQKPVVYIMIEKNEQLPSDNPRRKFKHRVVLLGNQVKDPGMADAIFHDLGNSPATFEASRWADFLGSVEGWEVQVAALWMEMTRKGRMEAGINSEDHVRPFMVTLTQGRFGKKASRCWDSSAWGRNGHLCVSIRNPTW